MPWQIRLHWLVAILLVITCVTIELRDFAEPGSAPGTCWLSPTSAAA